MPQFGERKLLGQLVLRLMNQAAQVTHSLQNVPQSNTKHNGNSSLLIYIFNGGQKIQEVT